MAASFQAAVVDVLVSKLLCATEVTGFPTVVVAGGVAANSALRARLLDEARGAGLRVVVPRVSLCTDNAAMIGSVGWWRLKAEGPTPLSSGAWPTLRLPGSE